MAIPQIDVSTRRLEIAPDRHYAPSVWGEIGQMAGDTGRLLAGTFDRIAEVREREAERRRLLEERNARALDADARRQAEYNQMLANNFIANNAVGYETVDQKTGQRTFVPGKFSKSRAEMTAEGTDSVKLTRGIINDMREQEWYRNMTPDVRRYFDRQFLFTQDKWMRNAAENDIKSRNQERVETMKALIGERAKAVQSFYGSDDNSFMRAATTASFRNMLDLDASAVENLEAFENVAITPQNAKEVFSKIKWRGKPSEKQLQEKYNRFLSGVSEFSINRITALQKAAANNQSLGMMNPDQCLAKADDMVNVLRATKFTGVNSITGMPDDIMTEDQANAIRAETSRARGHLDGIRQVEERKKRNDKMTETLKSELSIRNVPPELWADSYETLGRDKALQEMFPEKAMQYLDTARQLREAKQASQQKLAAQAAAQAIKDDINKQKNTEEQLSAALSRMELLKFEGSLSQKDENEAQAALWRKFRIAALGGGISPSFMRSFQSRLESNLSQQEIDAVKKLYRAFGYKGEISSNGAPPAADKKKANFLDFYAPSAEGEEEKPRYKKISGRKLFEYTQSVLNELKSLGPEVNREAILDREISRLKTEWIKEDLKANIDASVKSIIDMRRNWKSRINASQMQSEDALGDYNGK